MSPPVLAVRRVERVTPADRRCYTADSCRARAPGMSPRCVAMLARTDASSRNAKGLGKKC